MVVQPSELLDDALLQERNDREAAAENERAGFREEHHDLPEHVLLAESHADEPSFDEPDPDHHTESSEGGHQRLTPSRAGAREQDDHSREDEELGELGLGHDRHQSQGAENSPQQWIALVGRARELVRRDRDDRDHCGANSVKERLHPPQPAEPDVRHRDAEDHEERRHDEREPDGGRADHSVLEVPQRDGQLRRERTRHDLRERQRELVLVLRDRAILLDEIPMHETGERDGTTESEAAQVEEIPYERAETGALSCRRLYG